MSEKKPIITFTTDFGVQSQGIGHMEAVVADIAPQAHVIHLMHGLPDFDIRAAARTMETIYRIPTGYHVCVVDPGVGTQRKGIIIQTKRGDFFIGPDNGIFMSAVGLLGGCEKVVQIENPEFMHHPVSPIFHGRDVFAPAAAHLANGVPIESFGSELNFSNLVPGPYTEAKQNDNTLEAEVIYINKFGSLHLNILDRQWDTFAVATGEEVQFVVGDKNILLTFVQTFGDVAQGQTLILKDDYGRTEVAVNCGRFGDIYGVSVGEKCTISKTVAESSV